jgi:hypothetical protein
MVISNANRLIMLIYLYSNDNTRWGEITRLTN